VLPEISSACASMTPGFVRGYRLVSMCYPP